MSGLSDTSAHEGDLDLVEEYENRGSDNDVPILSDNESRNGDDEEAEEETKGRRIDPATSRKTVVRNPQPKLNTERLKGPKGIHTIEKYFEGFKFHGKGHEKADLDRIMKRMEHWGHRLFPKLYYDDLLARLEALGTKKDLQVFVKRYRMDMVRADEDVISREIIEDDEKEEDTGPIDEFDMLIAEQIEKQKQAVQQRTLNSSASEEAFNQLLPNPPSQSSQPVKTTNPLSQQSDEVKARIERNRQQALERKMARMKEREEEAKRKKLEETGNTGSSEESMNINMTELQEANNCTANEKVDAVDNRDDSILAND